MNTKLINHQIEDGTYGFDLKQQLYACRQSDSDQKNHLELIIKLLRVDLLNFNIEEVKNDFNKEDLSILKSLGIANLIANKEVIGRWLDVLLSLDKKYLKENIKLARTSYAAVYQNNGDYIYLIRSIALIRYAKILFEQDSKILFEEAKKAVITAKAPYLQKRLLIEMVRAFGQAKCQKEFSQILNKQIYDFYKRNEFDAVRFTIESLHVIKSLSVHEYRIKLAESYEHEADQQVSTKQPNTFYPTISQTFLKGLKQLKSIRGCEELRKRLEKKVAEEQQEDFKMIQAVGVNLLQDLDFQRLRVAFAKLEINSFTDGYHALLDIPIIPDELIEKEVSNGFDSNGYSVNAFSKQVKVNNKGAHVATQNIKQGYGNSVRMIYRERVLALIHLIKNKIDVYEEVTESFINELLNRISSPFIPESRKYLYVIGITKGFNNDFISAAHILMPQIENSLRHFAVQNGVNVTTWEKELQHENLLGGCLEKLRPIANPDLINEMLSFLVDGNSLNFRNELLHGLTEPIEIQKYGMYLWWLTLKLVVQTKPLFPNAK